MTLEHILNHVVKPNFPLSITKPEYDKWAGPFLEVNGRRLPLDIGIQGEGTVVIDFKGGVRLSTIPGVELSYTERKGDEEVRLNGLGIYEVINKVRLPNLEIVKNYLKQEGTQVQRLIQIKKGDLVTVIIENKGWDPEFDHVIHVRKIQELLSLSEGVLLYETPAYYIGRINGLGGIEAVNISLPFVPPEKISSDIVKQGIVFVVSPESELYKHVTSVPCISFEESKRRSPGVGFPHGITLNSGDPIRMQDNPGRYEARFNPFR